MSSSFDEALNKMANENVRRQAEARRQDEELKKMQVAEAAALQQSIDFMNGRVLSVLQSALEQVRAKLSMELEVSPIRDARIGSIRHGLAVTQLVPPSADPVVPGSQKQSMTFSAEPHVVIITVPGVRDGTKTRLNPTQDPTDPLKQALLAYLEYLRK